MLESACKVFMVMSRKAAVHCTRFHSALLVAGLAAILMPSFAPAQTTFERTYGGTSDDEALSAQLTSDGGCIVTGSGGGAALLAKFAPDCAYMEWMNTYSNRIEGRSVRQTADGGYIATGVRNSSGTGDHDVWLIKVDARGNTIWDTSYGGTACDEGNSVQPTPDGGYIICGYTASFGTGPSDVWLIKTDSMGKKMWDRTFGGTDYDGGNDVQVTRDGGFIITGFTWSVRPDIGAVLLLKTDSLGVTEWSHTFGGADEDWGTSVQATEGGYLVAGTFGSAVFPDGSSVYLVRTDANGDSLWTRTFGGEGSNWGYSVCQTTDGGCVVTGYTESFGLGKQDVYLIRTDSNGDTLWTRAFGGAENDMGRWVQQTADGGYFVAGYTGSYGAGGYDIYLIKTDALGRLAVAEPKASPTRAPCLTLSCEPNPCRVATRISLTPQASSSKPLTLRIYDVQGRIVRSFSSLLSPPCSLTWDCTDDAGQLLPSGAYMVRCDAAGQHASARVVLQR